MMLLAGALLFLGTALLTLTLTRGVRSISLRFGLLDVPNQRSSHTTPVPRTGGLAIVASATGALLLLAARGIIGWHTVLAIVPPALLIAAVGLIDDVRGVPVWARLLAQTVAIVWFLIFMGGPPDFNIEWLEDNSLLKWTVVALALIWVVNMFNFMDGIDGLAASEAIFVGAGVMVIEFLTQPLGDSFWVTLVTVAAALGFLRWNWAPAKVFMGDSGSGFLGFMLGVLSVEAQFDGEMPLAVPIILLAVFLVDATVTLMRRVLRGDKWYAAHRSHAYQRLSRRLASHRTVTIGVLVVNAFWLLPLATLAALYPTRAFPLLLVAVVPFVGAALWLGAGQPD